MPTIYSHEIQAYRDELEKLCRQFESISEPGCDTNLTHASLAASNRASLMVVGLCSLVESYMYELVEANPSQFELSDIRGQGTHKLKRYLSRIGAVDFGPLKSWASFQSVYKLRNFIVHSYGGLVESGTVSEVQRHLEALSLEGALVGGRRLRLGPESVKRVLAAVDELLDDLGAYAT